MYEQAISKIQDYMEKHIPAVTVVYPRYKIEIVSCARWAANELIERFAREDAYFIPGITDRVPLTTLEIIDEFIDLVDYCGDIASEKGDYQMQETMNIAHNTAMCIKHSFA